MPTIVVEAIVKEVEKLRRGPDKLEDLNYAVGVDVLANLSSIGLEFACELDRLAVGKYRFIVVSEESFQRMKGVVLFDEQGIGESK